MKRIRCEVRHNKKIGWCFYVGRELILLGPIKATILVAAMDYCRGNGRRFVNTELFIKRLDGTIQDARTYPRSSDPRRSRG